MIAIHPRRTGMVATLSGLLALPLGLLILLLPLLATELSRPRDSAWGAVLLLLALVLVTSADRLSGAPMLGVLCGALLIGRLGSEVALARWRQLSEEEQRRLASLERWSTSFRQLGATLAGAATQVSGAAAGLSRSLLEGRSGSAGAASTAPQGAPPSRAGGRSRGKLWVRPEADQAPAGSPAQADEPTQDAAATGASEATPGQGPEPTEAVASSEPESTASPAAQAPAAVGAPEQPAPAASEPEPPAVDPAAFDPATAEA